MIKNIIKLIIILIISIILGNILYGVYREAKISNVPNNNVQNSVYEAKSIKQSIKKEILSQEYKGYKVSSKLDIPKIKLETYVLDDKSEDAMWICPTKYYGPEPNKQGNYCIAAHNYDKENMFNHIIELELKDKIYLSDNENGKIEYEVYDIYKASPTDTKPLLQETNGNIEITLITCSDYSSKRIIVKARAIIIE